MRNKKMQLNEVNIRLLFLIAACMLVVFVLLKSFFAYNDPKLTDLVQIKGTVSKYQLGGSRSENLYIWLKGHQAAFFVSSVQLKYMDYERFTADAGVESSVSLYISKKDSIRLRGAPASNKKILVYGVYTDNYSYLTIEKFRESEKANVRFGMLMGIVLIFIIGFFIHLFIEAGYY